MQGTVEAIEAPIEELTNSSDTGKVPTWIRDARRHPQRTPLTRRHCLNVFKRCGRSPPQAPLYPSRRYAARNRRTGGVSRSP